MLDLVDLEGGPTHLRTLGGRTIPLDVDRWLGAADAVDQQLLARAVPPVLDVGCGPGRHVRALWRRGIPAMGLDVSATAVSLARSRGTPVLKRSVFEPPFEPGWWRTALLLDGSIGIGGDPVSLLRHVAGALADDGQILVETESPDVPTESLVVSLGPPGGASRWFPWSVVSARDIGDIAVRSGFSLGAHWEHDGRWFAQLVRSDLISDGRTSCRDEPAGR